MTSESRAVRQQLMIALVCAALVVYIVLLGRTAILMIGSGRAVTIALGGALLILPAIGVWAMVATVRAAGERGRAREAMKKTVQLQGRQ